MLFQRKHQVLRAGLRQCVQPTLLRMLELAQSILVGKMHDVHGGVRHVRDGDGAMGGLRFRMRRTAVCVEVRCRLALGDHPRHDDIDHTAILRVHAAERMELAGLMHHFEHQRIVDHQHVGIGHEKLER